MVTLQFTGATLQDAIKDVVVFVQEQVALGQKALAAQNQSVAPEPLPVPEPTSPPSLKVERPAPATRARRVSAPTANTAPVGIPAKPEAPPEFEAVRTAGKNYGEKNGREALIAVLNRFTVSKMADLNPASYEAFLRALAPKDDLSGLIE